jgi:hypothetical protein
MPQYIAQVRYTTIHEPINFKTPEDAEKALDEAVEIKGIALSSTSLDNLKAQVGYLIDDLEKFRVTGED